MKSIHLLIVITLITVISCNSNKVPKDAKKVSPIADTNKNSSSFSLSNFTLAIPSEWTQEQASSQMRVTQFALNKTPEHKVVISFFGNNDSMIKANIERWKSQFSEQDSYETLKVENNNNIIAIKILGTYKLKSFPMAQDFTETPNYGVLAAIVPSEEGPYYLKLTAPKNIIEEETARFIEVLNSYK